MFERRQRCPYIVSFIYWLSVLPYIVSVIVAKSSQHSHQEMETLILYHGQLLS